jgi:hypothetical protein
MGKIITNQPKKKKIKKPLEPRKKLEKELDTLWSLIVRNRWGHKCCWPGCDNVGNQPHHFFHKAQGLRARWLIDNGVCLCFAHHIFQVHGKGDTEPIRDILIAKIGQTEFDLLKVRVRETWKPTMQDLQELKERFVQLNGKAPG